MGASTLEAVLEAFETKYDLEGRPEVNNSLALVDLTGVRRQLTAPAPSGSASLVWPTKPHLFQPLLTASGLVCPAGSETESSLKQLMMSSLGKVLDKKSNWHTLQAARRQLQNQRFLTRKFQGTWISIKL